MRVFVASVATETNTFSPVFTCLDDFRDTFYYAPGTHPDKPSLCSAPFIVCRERVPAAGGTLIEGTAAWAEPAGLVNQKDWEKLRDEILGQLRAALPVDAVVLGLHGAMVAQDCDDCEGELLEMVRKIAGPKAVIGATYDPHSHLSERRLKNSDITIAFKEFPHIDTMERAHDLVRLAIDAVRGRVKPVTTVFDCRMIDVMPTSAEPMRSFVDRIKEREKEPGILSISVIHGFMAGDVPDMGAKIVVVTDGDAEKGAALARELGMELFGLRGQTRMPMMDTDAALDEAATVTAPGPVVIADVWDNPGGGVAGDSTVILRHLLARNADSAVVGLIWDPVAVRLCFAAGEGARIPLRFGGKSGPNCGEPVDGEVEVLKLVPNAVQKFGSTLASAGDVAAIRIGGVEVLLGTIRLQIYSTDLFESAGVDPRDRRIVVVKSTNHFRSAYEKIASRILYVDSGAPYPSDPRKTSYRKLSRKLWPMIDNPHAA